MTNDQLALACVWITLTTSWKRRQAINCQSRKNAPAHRNLFSQHVAMHRIFLKGLGVGVRSMWLRLKHNHSRTRVHPLMTGPFISALLFEVRWTTESIAHTVNNTLSETTPEQTLNSKTRCLWKWSYAFFFSLNIFPKNSPSELRLWNRQWKCHISINPLCLHVIINTTMAARFPMNSSERWGCRRF